LHKDFHQTPNPAPLTRLGYPRGTLLHLSQTGLRSVKGEG
jgi:hypothetical protein